MKNIRGEELPLSAYKKNETMKFLGKQKPCTEFWHDETIRKQVQDVAKARPFSFTTDAASDLFMLGYIAGKRAERRKKNIG